MMLKIAKTVNLLFFYFFFYFIYFFIGIVKAIRIEWVLTGFGGAGDDYTGWYIDDVVVTETNP